MELPLRMSQYIKHLSSGVEDEKLITISMVLALFASPKCHSVESLGLGKLNQNIDPLVVAESSFLHGQVHRPACTRLDGKYRAARKCETVRNDKHTHPLR